MTENKKRSRNTTGRGQLVLTISTAVIAMCALVVSINQLRWSIKDRRMAVRPEVYTSFYYSDEGSGWRMFNSGPGHARLYWFKINVDGVTQPNWNRMVGALGLSTPPGFQFTNPHPGMIEPHVDSLLFWAPPSQLSEDLNKVAYRVDLLLCYCSAYDECWISAYGTQKSVDSCYIQKEPTGIPGFGFRAVPANRLNPGTTKDGEHLNELDHKVPADIHVDFGAGNVIVQPLKSGTDQILFNGVVPFIPGNWTLPLKLRIERGGRIVVTARIFDNKGTEAATINDNNITVVDRDWDRNWDSTALEIVNERTVPFFQIIRTDYHTVKLRGVFRTLQGNVIVFADSGVVTNPTSPVNGPQKLFIYPSEGYLHQRLP